MTPGPASVRDLGSAFLWFSVTSGQVGSSLSLITDNNMELCSVTFDHAPLGLIRVVPSDRYLVDKYILLLMLNHLTVLSTR